MPPQLSFTGYVLSIIDEKRICVRVDPEYVDAISTYLSSFNDKTVIKTTVIINIRECDFNVTQIDWNNLNNLVGVQIKITALFRQYQYWKNKEIIDRNNNSRITSVKYKGVSIIAKKISNVIEA